MEDSYTWGPVPISPEDIEASLSDLWKRDPLAGAARLCTTNLLVFLKGSEQKEDTHLALAKLVALNPGRAVVIAPVPGLSELRAHVAARCELPPDRSTLVCCDQILLEADVAVMPRALSLLVDLLVPELPVFAWWRGDPPRPHQFPSAPLKGLVTKLIFDSQEFTTWASFQRAKLLAQAMECPLGDLTWDRLAPWRAAAMAALTAEEAQAARREFHTLNFSMVQGGNFAQPLLFTCWIAALLGMVPASAVQEGQQLNIHFQGGNPLTVTWNLQENQALPGGSLLTLELLGHDHTLQILRTHDGCLQCAAQVHGRHWHSVISWADRPLHQLLGEELSQFGRNDELERALDLALQMLRLLDIDLE